MPERLTGDVWNSILFSHGSLPSRLTLCAKLVLVSCSVTGASLSSGRTGHFRRMGLLKNLEKWKLYLGWKREAKGPRKKQHAKVENNTQKSRHTWSKETFFRIYAFSSNRLKVPEIKFIPAGADRYSLHDCMI
jgi:hypothetical protein